MCVDKSHRPVTETFGEVLRRTRRGVELVPCYCQRQNEEDLFITELYSKRIFFFFFVRLLSGISIGIYHSVAARLENSPSLSSVSKEQHSYGAM